MDDLIKEYGGADLLDLDAVKSFAEFCYSKGGADTIEECIDKLYEVTPQTADEKLDMVFVNALRELKSQKM